ncbi:hypothetical protein GCM10009117_01270 [Gangjinia marincola]|uniref:Uncharacterized protein n=1 Tax=Gangjinia marincola TaxID=578463 RepID=A0ABN1MDA3_9FLAO
MFENLEERATNIKDSSKIYLEKQIDYTKLKIFYHVTSSAIVLIKSLSIGICIFVAILFLSIALSLGLNQWLDHKFLGYIITGIVYVIIAIISYAFRHTVERKVVEKFSKSFFKDGH